MRAERVTFVEIVINCFNHTCFSFSLQKLVKTKWVDGIFFFAGLNLGLNSTFNKGPIRSLNATFAKDASPALNSTFEIADDVRPDHHNGTFSTKPMTSLLNKEHNATFDISNNATFEVIRNQDNDIDRLSSTSDSSVSHRLNDLGDVQHLARMQEESELLSNSIWTLVFVGFERFQKVLKGFLRFWFGL